MTNKKNNITLIGMSGVGKSTFGRELSYRLAWNYIDIDILIKNEFNNSLSNILGEIGQDEFIKKEEQHVMTLKNIKNTVISPGGSIIYSSKSMNLLKEISLIFYLSIKPETLADRIGGENRGIIGLENTSFIDLYRKRIPLYEKNADYVIDIDNKNMNMILDEISQKVFFL